MPNHAQATIIGHLGRDPEFKESGENLVCRFSVATTRKRKAGDVTTWWNCTAWRQSAGIIAKFLKKGDAICVVGTPYIEVWEDKNKQVRETLKLDVNEVVLLGKSNTPVDAADQPAPAKKPTVPTASTPDDEPPF